MYSFFFRKGLILAVVIAAFSFFTPSGNTSFLSPGPAHAQDDWKKEFDSICTKTDGADSFSPQELKDLIGRCDALKPLIEKLEESERKVMLKRLKMCRDLFVYVLQSKETP